MIRPQKALALAAVFNAALAVASEGSPPSFYSMPPGAQGASGITEPELKLALIKIEILAQNEFAEAGKGVVAVGEWENPYFAAFAVKRDGVDSVHVWGGLVRLPGMTEGALAFTLCHELGHLRGGAPLQTLPFSEWASAEGQADTFAGGCLRRWIQDFGDEGFSAPRVESAQSCNQDGGCALAVQAEWEFFAAAQYFEDRSTRIELNPLRDAPEVVSETLINQYPSPLCRLQSVRAGAMGAPRPACWFHP